MNTDRHSLVPLPEDDSSKPVRESLSNSPMTFAPSQISCEEKECPTKIETTELVRRVLSSVIVSHDLPPREPTTSRSASSSAEFADGDRGLRLDETWRVSSPTESRTDIYHNVEEIDGAAGLQVEDGRVSNFVWDERDDEESVVPDADAEENLSEQKNKLKQCFLALNTSLMKKIRILQTLEDFQKNSRSISLEHATENSETIKKELTDVEASIQDQMLQCQQVCSAVSDSLLRMREKEQLKKDQFKEIYELKRAELNMQLERMQKKKENNENKINQIDCDSEDLRAFIHQNRINMKVLEENIEKERKLFEERRQTTTTELAELDAEIEKMEKKLIELKQRRAEKQEELDKMVGEIGSYLMEDAQNVKDTLALIEKQNEKLSSMENKTRVLLSEREHLNECLLKCSHAIEETDRVFHEKSRELETASKEALEGLHDSVPRLAQFKTDFEYLFSKRNFLMSLFSPSSGRDRTGETVVQLLNKEEQQSPTVIFNDLISLREKLVEQLDKLIQEQEKLQLYCAEVKKELKKLEEQLPTLQKELRAFLDSNNVEGASGKKEEIQKTTQKIIKVKQCLTEIDQKSTVLAAETQRTEDDITHNKEQISEKIRCIYEEYNDRLERIEFLSDDILNPEVVVSIAHYLSCESGLLFHEKQ